MSRRNADLLRASSGIRARCSDLRRILLLALVAVALAPAAADAAGPLGLSCGDQGGGIRLCEGKVRTFDGVPLDANLAVPSGSALPLVVLSHGYGARSSATPTWSRGRAAATPCSPSRRAASASRAGASRRAVLSTGGGPAVARAFDPIAVAGDGARTSAADEPGTASYRLPPARASGYALLGAPTVTTDLRLAGAFPLLALRLLDVGADGGQTLVARGRESDGGQTFQLHPGGLRLRPRSCRDARAAGARRPVWTCVERRLLGRRPLARAAPARAAGDLASTPRRGGR